MAIDTRNKRASALLVGQPWRGGVFPAPDGAISQADRQQAAGYYSGILAATSVLPAVDATWDFAVLAEVVGVLTGPSDFRVLATVGRAVGPDFAVLATVVSAAPQEYAVIAQVVAPGPDYELHVRTVPAGLQAPFTPDRQVPYGRVDLVDE